MAEYEAKILRLSRYAYRLVSIDYKRSFWLEEGFRYDLRVLIAHYKERLFATLVDNTKIAEEVKRTECERRDQ